MRFLIKLFFCFSLIFFSNSIFAEANVSAQQFIQLLDQIKNLQANFAQVIYDGNGATLQETSGEMSLQRPGKFRWITKKPNKQQLIADGSQVWFYDVDLAQVTVQKQSKTANSPAMLLSGSIPKLVKDFTIAALPTSDSNVTAFKLKPKIKNNFFQAVELYFAENTLQKMQLIDNLNQTTQVNFSKVQTNSNLNPSLFIFKLPKNVDLVRQ